jgi:hypothetical protein
VQECLRNPPSQCLVRKGRQNYTNHLHLIDLCGIRFNLLVGSRIPPQLKNLCVFRQGQKCVLVAKQQEAMLAKIYHEHLKVMAGSH